jgi:threonine aldolase
MAVLGGIVPKPLPTDVSGRMDVSAIEDAVSENDPHLPRTRLILLENSYGARNGFPLPPEYFASVRNVADRYGLAIHLDGARLFNAVVALNVAPQAVTRYVDSVSFCLSKGLSAPVGSILCGTEEFIKEARRTRKLVGGGMRQAGILAAAGLVALDQMVDRLADDHERARRLAEGLRAIPGLVVLPPEVRTNIVYFDLEDGVPNSAADIIDAVQRDAQIWLGSAGERRFRAVTHAWIGDDDVARLLEAVRRALT